MTNTAFLLPHPIVHENSEFVHENPAYHPSKADDVQSPSISPFTNSIQKPCHGFWMAHSVCPQPNSTRWPQPQTAADMPTCSNRSENDLSANSYPPVTPSPPNPPIDLEPVMLSTKQIYHSPLLVVLIPSHGSKTRQIRYLFHMTNNITCSNIAGNSISPRLIVACWEAVTTKSHENPHTRRWGRPHKENGSLEQLKTCLDPQSTNLHATTNNNFNSNDWRRLQKNNSTRSNSTRDMQTLIRWRCSTNLSTFPNIRIENVEQFRNIQTKAPMETSQTITHMHYFGPIITLRRYRLRFNRSLQNSWYVALSAAAKSFRSQSRSPCTF